MGENFEKACNSIAAACGCGKFKLIFTESVDVVDKHSWKQRAAALGAAVAVEDGRGVHASPLRLTVVQFDPYNDPAALVDPFWACGSVALPQPQGVAAAWYWPKALTGTAMLWPRCTRTCPFNSRWCTPTCHARLPSLSLSLSRSLALSPHPFFFFPKGNTHPGACRPNGMMSVCSYSGAYPSGYGLNMPSYSGAPSNLMDGDFAGASIAGIPGQYNAEGFTHFQPSGTGSTF